MGWGDDSLRLSPNLLVRLSQAVPHLLRVAPAAVDPRVTDLVLDDGQERRCGLEVREELVERARGDCRSGERLGERGEVRGDGGSARGACVVALPCGQWTDAGGWVN